MRERQVQLLRYNNQMTSIGKLQSEIVVNLGEIVVSKSVDLNTKKSTRPIEIEQ